MSIFSDYEAGAIMYDEFKAFCRQMDRQDRYERDHEFDEPDEEEVDEE